LGRCYTLSWQHSCFSPNSVVTQDTDEFSFSTTHADPDRSAHAQRPASRLTRRCHTARTIAAAVTIVPGTCVALGHARRATGHVGGEPGKPSALFANFVALLIAAASALEVRDDDALR